MAYEFKLPDIGEGLHEGEIVKWHVKEGDSIRENQPLVDVLTDKATVEIPSPKTGKIAKLMAQPGQIVKVGQTMVTIAADGEAIAPPASVKQPAGAAQSAPSPRRGEGGGEGVGAGRPAPAAVTAPAPSGAFDFKLPDIGEGLHEGEVVKWHVKEGDAVKENQPLVDVLTDKATVEIPSPKTGTVLKLMAKAGQIVQVGQTLVQISVAGAASSSVKAPSVPSISSPLAGEGAGGGKVSTSAPTGKDVLATPAIRKLAKDLGVDLGSVRATGPQGRVTEADVRQAASSSQSRPLPPGEGARRAGEGNVPPSAPPAGPEERVPLRGIRRKTAEKMALSKRVIPHVTHVDEADLTALVALRQELKPEAEKRGAKLTFLPFIVKAVVLSLKQFPQLNAALDDERQEIVYKRYYNVGIATATEQGLFNPVVKGADKRDLWDLAKEIERVTSAARSGSSALADLQGGTFTITNIGGIGGLYATPIVVHPETGILGVMKIVKRPMVRDGQIVVRDMMNLCLSFDHRVLDGAEAAHFTNTLVKHLENPRTLL